MKKIALLIAGICGLTSMVSSQTFTNTRLLSESATKLKIASSGNYVKAVTMAKQKNWPLSYTGHNGSLAVLVGVDDFGNPKYVTTNNNTIAAATVRTNQLWPGGSSGLNLTGSSSNMTNKMGVWDGGGVLTSHIELTGRVTQKDNPSSTIDHATHVAGTMMASGVNPVARGMAYGIKGIVAYDFNNDQSEMATEAGNSLLLSNHSYSIIAGWNFNSAQNRWEFNGRYNETEDYKFGYYGDDVANLDEIAYNAPYYLVVKSAGNTRTENGPAVGQPYYRYNQSGQMASAGNRPSNISSNDGYDGISWDCGAKNILTVGAVSGLANGYSRKEDVQIASFSSFGPTDDGRIKPDIVADGVNVQSSIASANNAYASFSGTSMASPNATGSLLLLQEYYSKLKGGAFLRSATLKGLAIHTADEAGLYDGPDYQYGWGLLNVEKAAAVLTAAVTSNNASTSASLLYEETLAQGATYSKTVVASGKGKLQATICWTDVKGSVDATNVLNNRTKKLVNDLDIRITKGARTYMPWTLNVDNPAASAIPGDNITDNIERIDIDSTVPGQSYTITISHKGTLVKGPQAFSLLVSGVGGSAYCASTSGGGGARIDSVMFQNITARNSAGSKTYTDNTSLIANIEPGQSTTLKVGVGTADATTASRIVKVFMDYNNNGTFDLPGELVATSGVLNATAQVYTANINIPTSVTVGSYGLMRIIVQETGTAGDINACGAYGKGETQDYTLRVVSPSNDMAINGFISPKSLDCGTDSMYVSIALRNNGTSNTSNIPVTLTVASASGTVANVSATYPGTITPLTTVNYTFQTPVTLAAGTSYTFTATVNSATDQFSANNQSVTTFATSAKPSAPAAIGSICTGNVVNLKVTNPDLSNYYWYTTPTGSAFATGSSVATVTIPANKTYYVGKESRTSIGPANKLVYANGGYNHFSGNFMRFRNTVPVVIESVRLYVGNPGKLKITVANISNEGTDGSYNYSEISSTILDLYATRPNPGPNPSSATTNENPAGDLGAVYYLGLSVPSTGDHIINVILLNPDGTQMTNTVSNGASLFRNGGITGTTTYPMGNPLIAQFTGNSATSTDGSNIQSQFYYFFYDMKVNTGGCASDKTPVVVDDAPKPVISLANNKLVSSITTNIQWYLNGTAVANATSSPFSPTASGSYTVVATDALGCLKSSDAFNYTITAIDPVVAAAEINLKVSPNPNNGVFNLSFEVADKGTLTIDILNAAGQKAYTQTQSNFVGKYSKEISVPNLAAGVYMLRINHAKKNYVYKIIVDPK